MWLTKNPKSPYFQVRFPSPDGSGRIIQLSTKEVSERAAKVRAAEIVAEHANEHERSRKGGKVTVETVAAEYWDSELSKRKWQPFKWVNAIVTHLGDTTSYCDVTISDVAAFVDKIDGTVSDTTINRVLAIWRRMHNHAREIREYPVQSIRWAKLMRVEPQGRTRFLSDDELDRLLRSLPINAQAVVMFALSCGARKAQVLGLTWDRVDRDHATATVFRKSQKKYAPQVLDLNETAKAIIAHRWALKASDKVFDTKNFRKVWDKALRDADVKDFRFHDLRHTFATWMARKASLAILQKLLGHSNITTTMRYAHVQREELRDSVHKLPTLDFRQPANETDVPVRLSVIPDELGGK